MLDHFGLEQTVKIFRFFNELNFGEWEQDNLPRYTEIQAVKELKNKSFEIVLNLMAKFLTDESIYGVKTEAVDQEEEASKATHLMRTELIVLATAWYEHLMSALNEELRSQDVEFGLIDDSNFRIKPFPEIFFRVKATGVLGKKLDLVSLQLFTQNINPKPNNLTKDQAESSQFSDFKDIGLSKTLEKILVVNDSLARLIMEDDEVDFDFIKLDKMMTISKRRIHGRD